MTTIKSLPSDNSTHLSTRVQYSMDLKDNYYFQTSCVVYMHLEEQLIINVRPFYPSTGVCIGKQFSIEKGRGHILMKIIQPDDNWTSTSETVSKSWLRQLRTNGTRRKQLCVLGGLYRYALSITRIHNSVLLFSIHDYIIFMTPSMDLRPTCQITRKFYAIWTILCFSSTCSLSF